MAKTWGTPTWQLFHTMAEQVQPEFYDAQRSQIVAFIKRICSLLPCPVCQKHAMEYTKTLNDRVVPTKEHLKQYLFTFHNAVNERLKKPAFTNYEMYRTMKLREVFMAFERAFLRNVASRKFYEQQHRRNLVVSMRSYFMSNAAAFIWL